MNPGDGPERLAQSYRNPLFSLLANKTSCCRNWGDGVCTPYGAELARRTTEIDAHDL